MSFAAAPLAHLTAAAGELTEHDLPIPPWGYGVIAIGTFLVLLGITYSFRTVAAGR